MNTLTGKPVRRLVLSGGGPRGLGVLGALHYVDEQDGLRNIDEYWGTSAGSIICLLLSVGYTPFEAFHQFFMMDTIATNDELCTHSIFEHECFAPIELFGNRVSHFVERKLGKRRWTFKRLYKKTGKKINIIGANVDKMTGVCFNVHTHPNMNVIDAVEISCDLPYVFSKKVWQGTTYVDGGFINNYPINLADDGQHGVLGICAIGSMETVGDSHIGWLYRLIYMPIMELHRERLKNLSQNCVHVEIDLRTISLLNIFPSNRKKIQVFGDGYMQARQILLNAGVKIDPKFVDHESDESDHFDQNGWDIEWDPWNDFQNDRNENDFQE